MPSKKRISAKEAEILRGFLLNYATQSEKIVSLSPEEFGVIRKLYPNFPVILLVAIMKNHRKKVEIPFPEIVLLKKTEVPEFKWELPGGSVLAVDKTFQGAITRIAKETVDVSIQLHSIIGHRTEEPFGLICLALPKEKVRESDALRYFSLDKFPWGEVVPDHKQFVNSYTCRQLRLLTGVDRV